MIKISLTRLEIFFIFGWFSILVGLLSAGWTSTWDALIVPTMYPPFADMRTVQGSLSSLAGGVIVP